MRILIAALALAGLSACSTGSTFSPRPASIGSGPNKLKRAPCAGCEKKRQLPGLPEFMMADASSTRAMG
jgi:hypothetical protein